MSCLSEVIDVQWLVSGSENLEINQRSGTRSHITLIALGEDLHGIVAERGRKADRER